MPSNTTMVLRATSVIAVTMRGRVTMTISMRMTRGTAKPKECTICRRVYRRTLEPPSSEMSSR
jgi:hypothetical protein